jgi:hypothetical protein
MTANPPTPIPSESPPADHPENPLVELAKQFPDFNWHEAAEDRYWFAEEQAKGVMDAYWGKVVAVYKKQVIGVGDDYVAMLLELSPKYNVHPGRIVVVDLGE